MSNILATKPCIFLVLIVSIAVSSCKKSNQPPSIAILNAILPSAAGNGDTVTLSGQHLASASESISLNGYPVKIISSTDNTIKVVVPKLAGSGIFVLTSNGKTYQSPRFKYLYKATVTTLAGSGQAGTNDGVGVGASFNSPWGLTPDNAGNIYVADGYNRLIRKINTTSGAVTTIQIPLYVGNYDNFFSPYNIVFNKNDNALYVTDFNMHVLRISSSQIFQDIYQGDGPFAGIAIGPDGYLYVGNNTKGTITKISTDGTQVKLFASSLVTPRNIIFDRFNKMYVAGYDPSSASAAIINIDSVGTPHVVYTDKSFNGYEIAVDKNGIFYEADHTGNTLKLIEKSGNIVILAGSGTPIDADGVGTNASFDGPQGLTIDDNGVLYLSTYNYTYSTGNKIRKIVVD